MIDDQKTEVGRSKAEIEAERTGGSEGTAGSRDEGVHVRRREGGLSPSVGDGDADQRGPTDGGHHRHERPETDQGEASAETGEEEVDWALDPNWPFDDLPYPVYQRLLFALDQSVRYHARREAFFDRAHKGIRVLSFLTTASAVVALVGDESLLAKILAGLATVGQAVNLFFVLEQKARVHRDLRAEFQALRGEMMCEPATAQAVRSWHRKRTAIEAGEPPTMRVVNWIAHNEAELARGTDPGELVYISSIRAILAPFIDLPPADICHRNERPAWHRKKAKLAKAIRAAADSNR